MLCGLQVVYVLAANASFFILSVVHRWITHTYLPYPPKELFFQSVSCMKRGDGYNSSNGLSILVGFELTSSLVDLSHPWKA